MGYLIQRVPWGVQRASGPVGIDWNNNLTRNLVFAIHGEAGYRELVSGKAAFRPGLDGMRGSVNGAAFNKVQPWGSYSNVTLFEAPRKSYSAFTIVGQHSNVSEKQGYTGFMGAVQSNLTADGKLNLWDNNSGTSMTAVTLMFQVPGSAWNSSYTVYSSTTTYTNAFPIWQGNKVYSASWDKDANSGYGRCFYDGVEITRSGGSANTGVSNWTQSSAPAYLFVGGTFTGAANFLYIFDRALTPEEHLSIARNPSQLIR